MASLPPCRSGFELAIMNNMTSFMANGICLYAANRNAWAEPACQQVFNGQVYHINFMLSRGSLTRKAKGLTEAKPFFYLVAGEGFEPSTFGL